MLAGEMSHRVKNLLSIAHGADQHHLALDDDRGGNGEGTDGDASRRSVGPTTSCVPLPGPPGPCGAAWRPAVGAAGHLMRIWARLSGAASASAVPPASGIGNAAGHRALPSSSTNWRTNSLKYGALSVETGILDLSGERPRTTMSSWSGPERGGAPQIEPAEAVDGLWKQAPEKERSNQLGGTISYDWSPEGVRRGAQSQGRPLAV